MPESRSAPSRVGLCRTAQWGSVCSPLVLVILLLAGSPVAMAACPFCPPQTQTLNEKLTQSAVTGLAQWISAEKSQGDNPGRTTFEFLQLARDSRRRFQRGSRIDIPKHRPGQPGDLFLLFGKGEESLQWEPPEEITETAYQRERRQLLRKR